MFKHTRRSYVAFLFLETSNVIRMRAWCEYDLTMNVFLQHEQMKNIIIIIKYLVMVMGHRTVLDASKKTNSKSHNLFWKV